MTMTWQAECGCIIEYDDNNIGSTDPNNATRIITTCNRHIGHTNVRTLHETVDEESCRKQWSIHAINTKTQMFIEHCHFDNTGNLHVKITGYNTSLESMIHDKIRAHYEGGRRTINHKKIIFEA